MNAKTIYAIKLDKNKFDSVSAVIFASIKATNIKAGTDSVIANRVTNSIS